VRLAGRPDAESRQVDGERFCAGKSTYIQKKEDIMKRIRIIGLTLVAVFAITAVVASSASALQWLINGRSIAAPVAVKSSSVGSLLLADLAATGGSTAILCTGTDEGTVGPGNKDSITKITATGCSFESGKNGVCEASKPVTAGALHLPWTTELLTVGGKTRDMLTGTGGNVGWKVECTVAKIFKVSDECTSATAEPLMTNVTGGVDATFEASETASCTKGNSTSGMVIGTDLNENPSSTEILTTG
jgi:hypothetical protein